MRRLGQPTRLSPPSQVNLAHRLFRSAVYSPGLYTDAFNGSETGLEALYPSFAFGDDLFWASTWLYRATLNNIRSANVSYYQEAMSVTMDLAYLDLDIPGVSWDYVNNMALVHAATISGSSKFHEPAQSFVWDWVCDSDQVKYTRNGRAFYFQTPHLGATAAAASLAALYAKVNAGNDAVAGNRVMIRGALQRHIKCARVRGLEGREALGSCRSLAVLPRSLHCARAQACSALRSSKRRTCWERGWRA